MGANAKLASHPDEVLDADRLVIPGVGAFGDGMAGLAKRSLVTPIQKFVTTGRPVLGICLGAQLLMERGREFGVHRGLALIAGEVGPFSPQTETPLAKIPHVGWSALSFDPSNSDGGLLNGIGEGEFFYFTHSYVIRPAHAKDVAARTRYAGQDLAAIVHRDNVYGCQFHPEKSGAAGLRILKNFLEG
jgi:glutamine amidotransferase